MSYVCGKFASYSTEPIRLKPKAKTTIIVKDIERSNSMSYENMIKEFNSQSNMLPLPPDLRIDDRDIPQAKKFY